ncbi:MAG: YbaY family lipoprotein [Chloroflexi bacterium]|nr:YbaY family lipoprotein [Chloroflexota bacterium]
MSVSGEVTYTDDIVLPDDAVLTVQIQDISLADAAATVMGEQSYVTEGQQAPLPFSVTYDAAAIVDNHTYGLSIRITAADETLLFVNDTLIPVITNGSPHQRYHG